MLIETAGEAYGDYKKLNQGIGVFVPERIDNNDRIDETKDNQSSQRSRSQPPSKKTSMR
jgi:hypothetical protein